MYKWQFFLQYQSFRYVLSRIDCLTLTSQHLLPEHISYFLEPSLWPQQECSAQTSITSCGQTDNVPATFPTAEQHQTCMMHAVQHTDNVMHINSLVNAQAPYTQYGPWTAKDVLQRGSHWSIKSLFHHPWCIKHLLLLIRHPPAGRG